MSSGILGGPTSIRFPVKEITIFSGATAPAVEDVDLNGHSCVRVLLTGSALVGCSIKIEGRIAGASALREWKAVGVDESHDGEEYDRLTTYGMYDIDAKGLDRLRFTIESITSGSVNLLAAASAHEPKRPKRVEVSGTVESAARYPTVTEAVFSGAAANDSHDFNITGMASVRLQVTGSGLSGMSIKVEGRPEDSSAYRELKAVGSVDSNFRQEFSRITAQGIYDYHVVGFNRVRITVESLSAGTLNVRAVASALPAIESNVFTLSGTAAVEQQPSYINSVTVLSDAVAEAVEELDVTGMASALVCVTGSGTILPMRIGVTGRRVGGSSSVRFPVIAKATGGDEAGIPVTELTQEGFYLIDCTGLRELQFTVISLGGNGDVTITAATSPLPHVDPEPVPRYFSVESTSTGAVNVRGASTLRAQVMEVEVESVVQPIGFRVEGRPRGTSDWQLLPAIGPGRKLVPWNVNGPGIWEWDVRAVDEVRIVRNSSSTYYFAQFTVGYDTPTVPSASVEYGLKRFVRVVPEDGSVNGQFYALKALTDCTLSSAIRFIASYVGESSGDRNAGLEDTDQLLAGDVLYGPFDRVAIQAGVALAYQL